MAAVDDDRIEILNVTCPSCSKVLIIDSTLAIVQCPFCVTTFAIDDTIVRRHKDSLEDKRVVIQEKCFICGIDTDLDPTEAAEFSSKLEQLKLLTNQVVNVAKNLSDSDVMIQSAKDFLSVASVVGKELKMREQIELNMNADANLSIDKLCKSCRSRYLQQIAEKRHIDEDRLREERLYKTNQMRQSDTKHPKSWDNLLSENPDGAASLGPVVTPTAQAQQDAISEKTCDSLDSQELELLENLQPDPDLSGHISNVVKITKQFKERGLISTDIEEFVKACSEIKVRFEDSKKKMKKKENAAAKDVKYPTVEKGNVKKEEVIEEKKPSKDKVIPKLPDSAELKEEICGNGEVLQNRVQIALPPTQSSPKTNKTTISVANMKKLTEIMEQEGIKDLSFDSFLTACSDFSKIMSNTDDIVLDKNSQATINSKTEDALPDDALMELAQSLNSLINFLSEMQNRNKVSKNNDYMKKIQAIKKFNSTGCYSNDSYIAEASKSSVLDKSSAAAVEEATSIDSLPLPPCNYCRGITPVEEKREELCESCLRKEILEGNIGTSASAPTSQPVTSVATQEFDDTLGTRTKENRRIIRIKRIQNPDGSVKEVKETVTIKREKRDPTKVEMDADDLGDINSIFDYDQLLMTGNVSDNQGALPEVQILEVDNANVSDEARSYQSSCEEDRPKRKTKSEPLPGTERRRVVAKCSNHNGFCKTRSCPIMHKRSKYRYR